MRLLKALLTLALTAVRAQYTSFEFIYMTNSVPSNGVQASADVTHRPLELYWLSEIQKQNPNAVDVNIAKMIEQNTAASRVIRKYRKAHGNQRALIDFTYVFVLQVIGDGAQVQQSDVTGFFANTAFDGDADWTSVMNSHSITFQPAGLLHGTCKTEKGECREASVMTNACYDTHVIPFDENDSAAFNLRAANLSASVVELANAYYANSAFSINTEDTSVTVNSITPNFPAPQETAQVVDIGSPGDQFYAQWNFVKSTTENIHTICFSLTTTQNELFGQDVPTEQAIKDEAGLFIATLDNDKVNSQSVSYDYLCVAPACDPPLVWSEWSEWSQCSVTCGGAGEQTRQRTKGSEVEMENRACDLGDCPPVRPDSCPNKGSRFWWGKPRVTKVQFQAEDRTWLRINILNQNPDVNILEDEYHGFLTFTRKKCGADFLNAFLDGRITWELHDIHNVYEPQYAYFRNEQTSSVVTLQFHKRPGDIELKNSKKDQFYLVLRGLAQVNFGPKDPAQCLARIIPASKDIDNDAHVDWTQCVAHDKF